MHVYLLSGPTAVDGCGNLSNSSLFINPWSYYCFRTGSSRIRDRRRQRGPVTASAAVNINGQNHYAVLGVASDASSSDIKKAYRVLALKYHPDVSKDPGAAEIFKSIRVAYDVLSNDTTRDLYNRALRFQDSHRPLGNSWDYAEEDKLKIYRWAYFKQRMQHEKHWQRYQSKENFSFYDEADEMFDDGASDEERGSFHEVLKSAFLSLFLMQTVGARLSLTFSSLTAFLDRKLDNGYKIGYLIAWILGGQGGIVLTLLLSFASWLCGKTSSNLVALIVVGMWFGSKLVRFAPLPQGALLTLLYMSIKLQVDLKGSC